MNKKEFSRRVASVMREKNIRKPISSQKQVFHISDDDGNQKDFVIKKADKKVVFTTDDVESVINTCLEVIGDSIKSGEPISIAGFGKLGLNYRKPRKNKHPVTGEEVDVVGRYVPKFEAYKDLKMCAKIYELSLEERLSGYSQPFTYIEQETDGDE